ncbi:4-hydroxybenzoyl-coa thioesterase [Bacillus sp. OxB-1]|uniref:acyl-CoA thioesterase n=1 Tax=Bacillus sp. (strain OxB-1) TaxID=98228 RepID=UPI000582338B|nr:thioesterase family protein [Bacillus sp. OxB-1]BAQ09305.1 4-hydroxybenzoyl-coa thioesterase [Bacillus sp. OxB-1]
MAIDYRFKVRWGDTDPATIVFFPNFYRWMDEASHEFFEEIGYPTLELMETEQVAIPLLESKCKFNTPLRFNDDVVVKTEVAELQNRIFKLSHRFYRGETFIAEGYTLRAWTSFEGETPKAVPIPEDVREKLAVHLEGVESK